MNFRKSFSITIRISFLLFTLQFLHDAFYKWDGFSYYMDFIEFLPELSLAFIVWTVMGIIIGILFWSIAIFLHIPVQKSHVRISIEHTLFIVLPLFLYSFLRIFSPRYLKKTGHFIGLSEFKIFAIFLMLVIVVNWIFRRHIEFYYRWTIDSALSSGFLGWHCLRRFPLHFPRVLFSETNLPQVIISKQCQLML